MAVSRLYYTPVFGEMQCRYGEIKAISCRDWEIFLRSKSFQSTEKLNDSIIFDYLLTIVVASNQK